MGKTTANEESKSTPKRRSKRKSARAYGEVTRSEIGNAALTVIEKHGLEGLSMRRVAEELKLSTMAAYYYVSSKNELLDVALECAMEKMPVTPEGPGSFSTRYIITFQKTLAAWRKYPGLYVVAMSRLDSPLMVRQTETLRADLMREGLTPAQVDSVILHLGSHFFGVSSMDHNVDEASRPEFERQVSESIMMMMSGIDSLIQSNKLPQDAISSGSST